MGDCRMRGGGNRRCRIQEDHPLETKLVRTGKQYSINTIILPMHIRAILQRDIIKHSTPHTHTLRIFNTRTNPYRYIVFPQDTQSILTGSRNTWFRANDRCLRGIIGVTDVVIRVRERRRMTVGRILPPLDSTFREDQRRILLLFRISREDQAGITDGWGR
jgi:hypothetical protein